MLVKSVLIASSAFSWPLSLVLVQLRRPVERAGNRRHSARGGLSQLRCVCSCAGPGNGRSYRVHDFLRKCLIVDRAGHDHRAHQARVGADGLLSLCRLGLARNQSGVRVFVDWAVEVFAEFDDRVAMRPRRMRRPSDRYQTIVKKLVPQI